MTFAMPSTEHELPLLLFRSAPGALAALVERAFGIEIRGPLVEAGASFAEIAPASYAADLVLRADDTTLVVEVQRARDDEKQRSWPLYAASAHASSQRPTWLVVIALDRPVAEWARRPAATFHGGCFAPLVIGPDEIPRIVDADVARAQPELAVLSALAHGHDADAEAVGRAALLAAADLRQIDEDRGKLYADAVLDALGDHAREIAEALMKTEGYEYRSDFARSYVAQGRAEGLRAGVRLLCDALELGWSDARERAIAALDAAELEALAARITRERCWPD
ncbi:MAG: hypothetical protein M3Y87_35205 [Myxococcota bacterium]|nr:hypothetical protein [Myxococcota bacterium]